MSFQTFIHPYLMGRYHNRPCFNRCHYQKKSWNIRKNPKKNPKLKKGKQIQKQTLKKTLEKPLEKPQKTP
jgi:hypothetical protein